MIHSIACTAGARATARSTIPFLTLLVAGACASGRSERASPAPGDAARIGTATARTSQDRTAEEPQAYDQVITGSAQSDTGVFVVHKVADRWYFEIPDSLLGRDMLFISRIAGVPAGIGGFLSAGTSLAERVVRWERHANRVLARNIRFDAVADDTLPIAISVANNNVGPILAAFSIAAIGPDSTSTVIEVTDFFAGDTPALSGLSPAQRRQYQVRRLDTDRSFIDRIRSYPLNIEVRHTQTFDATAPPGDAATSTVSLEMRQSIVLLPAEPMRPRYEDPRAGFFSITRVNYGLDEQKAGEQRFIRRWRLEPSDPEAYARGELVEPVKPIVYYIDPATPEKWRQYVRLGIEDWQEAFETAGFRNAILARDPPSPEEDPEWDPEDSRNSVVRWAASLVRNAVGPSTSDPRTGEIIESDITWFHNHMRSYRNRLLIETGAANPAARSLDIPEELMGETMRQVIAHEVGHALGLPHNMIGSSALPVDSLRSPTFTSMNGVSPSIMDYARQNYVAQPGDGLAPKDFIRRIGPYDHYIINWGYRVLPEARTPEDERPVLDRWIRDRSDDPRFRYLPQQLSGVDPRSQTEDIGDDPLRASAYAVENLKRVVPNLVQWTSTPGEGYSDLQELYGELLGQWSRYMGHVVTLVGGVYVDLKTTEQEGAVYSGVPTDRQQEALEFLSAHVFATPAWLAPREILDRIGPPAGALSVANRQAGIVAQLLDTRRLGRLQALESLDANAAWPLADYLAALKAAVWGTIDSRSRPDLNRRTLQRVYLERLEAIVTPPESATPGFPSSSIPPFLAPPDLDRSDIVALARAQLQEIRDQARNAAARAPRGLLQAHWNDVADRAERILDPVRG